MVQKYVTPSGSTGPNKDAVVNMLKMLNFKFNSDGSLMADSSQPFQVQTTPAVSLTASSSSGSDTTTAG